MILHATSIAAFFLQQTPQPQCIVKCITSSGQDPLLARLLFDAIPSIFALGIAWMAFHWNRQKESDQWVRDQRKSEWRNLLDSFNSIQEALPSAFSEQLVKLLGKDPPAFDKHLLNVAMFRRQMNTLLFAADSVKAIELSEKFDNLIELAKSMKIIKDSAGRFEAFEKTDMDSYLSQFNTLVNMIHKKAVSDLNS
jgi:hypothetical protein